MKVAVIPTGTAELAGIRGALERVFAGHEFVALEMLPRQPFNGFTSCDIRTAPVDRQSSAAKIVQRAAAALEECDHVVVLDDLELENLGQVELVLAYFRATVTQHLAWIRELEGEQAAFEVAEALRARASLHLAVPMLEAWFFADPTAGARLGVPGPLKLPDGVDPESFVTDDAAYASDDCSGCTTWCAIQDPRKRKQHRPEWARADRRLHPKAYLAWLLKEPGDKRCSKYRETKQGVLALEQLD